MIVKNESSAIRNCLHSIKDIIDTWVIADTGSEDGTQEIIQDTLKDLPGELHEIPWVDFAECRNKALQLSFGKADYILFIDADEEMVVQDGFDKAALDQDAYFIRTKGPAADHFRLLLIKSDPRWRWEGSLHEHLVHDHALGAVLPSLVNLCKRRDGRRSQDPRKYLLDAELLEKERLKEPNNPRTLLYLAQSYGNAGEFALALEHYQKRAAIPGSREEIFWSLYCIGHMQEHLRRDLSDTLGSFCRAFHFDPRRAEPLERLASNFLDRGWPLLGYLTAKFALSIPMPVVIQSNVHSWVYDYQLLCLSAECAFLLFRLEESKKLFEELLKKPDLPEHILTHAQNRLQNFFEINHTHL